MDLDDLRAQFDSSSTALTTRRLPLVLPIKVSGAPTVADASGTGSSSNNTREAIQNVAHTGGQADSSKTVKGDVPSMKSLNAV
jgi:hypothetical protein